MYISTVSHSCEAEVFRLRQFPIVCVAVLMVIAAVLLKLYMEENQDDGDASRILVAITRRKNLSSLLLSFPFLYLVPSLTRIFCLRHQCTDNNGRECKYINDQILCCRRGVTLSFSLVLPTTKLK